MSTAARILVADDDAVTRTMIEDKLNSIGDFEVVAVADGLAAIAELQLGEFDVVITDIMMPDITGQGVLEAVRHETPDTEVVVITGYGNVEMAFDCLRSGAFDFLEKPFKMNTLVETVRRALDRRRVRLSARHRPATDDGELAGTLTNWLKEFRPLWEKMAETKARVDCMLTELEDLLPGETSVSGEDDEPARRPTLTNYDKRPRERTDDVLQLLKEDPHNKKIQEWLAFEYYRNGELAQAIRCYRLLLERSPADTMARYYLANCHYKQGDPERARQLWCEVIEQSPGSPVSRKARKRMEACLAASAVSQH